MNIENLYIVTANSGDKLIGHLTGGDTYHLDKPISLSDVRRIISSVQPLVDQQTGEVVSARMSAMVVPLDFCLGPFPAVTVMASHVYKVSADPSIVKSVENMIKQCEDWELRLKAKESGIVIPGSSNVDNRG